MATLYDNPFSTENIDAKKICDKILSRDFVDNYKNQNHNMLNTALKLIENFPAKSNKYSKTESEEFSLRFTAEQLGLNHPNFSNILLSSGNINFSHFKSLQIMGYIIFYKFYKSMRTPKISDVPDIFISSLLPYVDVFITEGDLAEHINQIQSKMNFCEHLQINTIKDFAKS